MTFHWQVGIKRLSTRCKNVVQYLGDIDTGIVSHRNKHDIDTEIGLRIDIVNCMTIFSCLRLRQWPVTYLITLSDWITSCQPGRHAVVTVCEPDWKHKWAAYKSFDETSSFNNL